MREPGATVEVYTSKTSKTNIGTVAMCTRDNVSAATHTAAMSCDWTFLAEDKGVMWLTVVGSMLVLQRNECLRQMEGDWILFIDDDMVWQPDTIGRLVKSWEEQQAAFDEPVIMGALCHRRGVPFDPTLYMRDTAMAGKYRFLEKWDTAVVEVDATGLAFLLVPATALAAIVGGEWPNKETRVLYDAPSMFQWVNRLGEDLRFCQDAKAAGCHILVDTTIEIGHLTTISVARENYLAHLASRPQEDEDFVRAINDKYGLPTMSAQEAKEALGR